MEGKVDDMYMENLEEWIFEENKIVTYKYLSRALKCHVNVAKQMLFNFLEEKKKKGANFGVVYLLSGFCKSQDDGVRHMKVCLVKQSDLEKASSKFETVTSKHIYSLSKTQDSVSPTSIYATDYEAFKEDVFSGNALTAVKNKLAVPRSAEQIRKPPPPVAMVKTEVKAKTEVKTKPKSGIESAFAKAAGSGKKSPEEKKSEPAKKAASGSGKKPSGIANFFSKQAAKPLVEKKEVDKPAQDKKLEAEEAKEKISSDTSPGKENIVNQNIEKTKEEESKDKKPDADSAKTKEVAKKKTNDKKPTKKKPTKNQDDSKKRKRIQVMSDSEESEEEKEEPAAAMEEEEAPPQAALIESDDDEIIPATPKAEKKTKPGRKRVNKLVDKTFVDDKGYMVTKKVYESGSETDNEPSPVKKPVKTVPKKDSPPAPAAKKAKIMAPAGNKQQGIMSFFKKK